MGRKKSATGPYAEPVSMIDLYVGELFRFSLSDFYVHRRVKSLDGNPDSIWIEFADKSIGWPPERYTTPDRYVFPVDRRVGCDPRPSPRRKWSDII